MSISKLSVLLQGPPNSILFPYTTLFRSRSAAAADHERPSRLQAVRACALRLLRRLGGRDRKSTRLNSSHVETSYAVFCLKKKNEKKEQRMIVLHTLPEGKL